VQKNIISLEGSHPDSGMDDNAVSELES